MFKRYVRSETFAGYEVYDNLTLHWFTVTDQDLLFARDPVFRESTSCAARWLDEQLRKEADAGNLEAAVADAKTRKGPSFYGTPEKIAALKARIDGWTATLAAPEMVPVKIVRHEKPHCRYWLDPFEENAERIVLASTPTPIVPDCFREPGAMADHMKVYNGAVVDLEASVKRTIREWPLCSITGEAVPLRIDEHGDELIAFWNCRCGEEELP